MDNHRYIVIAAFGAALLVTLVLAAFLTPRSWWRRPNLRALSVLAVGTWGIGTLLLALSQKPALAAETVAAPILASATSVTQSAGGERYRVYDDLNLRAAKGVGAERIAVVPVGAVVTTTGVRDGDWWQVRARVDGKVITGWSSSLWLRRAAE
jgi:hypothetical protein